MADRAGGQGALRYEPGPDAAARYPDWVIRHRPLSHGIPEVMCRRRKVILIESADDWPSKRSSLAHAIAHLDLGHTELASGVFERDQEIDACQLAARRLVGLEELAEVLRWTQVPVEIAAELDVDVETLMTRRAHLHPSEIAVVREVLSRIEEVA